MLLPRADQQAEVEGQELQCQAHGHEETIQKQEVRILSGKLSYTISFDNGFSLDCCFIGTSRVLRA